MGILRRMGVRLKALIAYVLTTTAKVGVEVVTQGRDDVENGLMAGGEEGD